MDIKRKLIDNTRQEYFVNYIKKYDGLEEVTIDDIKKRYERLFVQVYLDNKKKIPLNKLVIRVPKYITFYIDNCISIRMSLEFKIAYDKEVGYYFYGDDLGEVLDSGSLKSMYYGVTNTVKFDNLPTLLNEIRKNLNTLYKDSEIDFIKDFYSNLYQEKILGILEILANTHFQEAIILKEGNSYSILYNDMESFKLENPSFEEEKELIYTDYMNFTSISPNLLNLKEQPVNKEFSELDFNDSFEERALDYQERFINNLLEDMSMEESTVDGELDIEKYLDVLENNKNIFYYDTIYEQQMDLLSLDVEFFTTENTINLLKDFEMLDDFYIRYKECLDEIEIEESFMKSLVIHFITLELFVRNLREYNLELIDNLERIDLKNKNLQQINI